MQGDEFSDICRIIVHPSEERDLNEDPLPGPGIYEITWHRYPIVYRLTSSEAESHESRIDSEGERGSTSVTRFPLPILSPPSIPNPVGFTGDDEELADAKNIGVFALLHVPPTAYLHEPFTLRLEIRNRHPTRTADITVQLEAVDTGSGSACIVAGPKSAHLGVMLPGVQEAVFWNVVPLECGWVKVPGVRVVDKRKGPRLSGDAGSGEGSVIVEELVVKVVEAKWERRTKETDQGAHSEEVGESVKTLVPEIDHVSTILVLPR
jgi:trafficking protein particle complex subunit 11